MKDEEFMPVAEKLAAWKKAKRTLERAITQTLIPEQEVLFRAQLKSVEQKISELETYEKEKAK